MPTVKRAIEGLFRVVKWKHPIMRVALGDLRYAFCLCKQAGNAATRKERRLRSCGLTPLEVQNETGPLWAEVFFLQDEYQELLSKKWLREASKWSVPIPQRPSQHDASEDAEGYWRSRYGGYPWMLTEKGVHHIRSEVRKVQKDERERWFPWLALLLPLLVALAALINSIFDIV